MKEGGWDMNKLYVDTPVGKIAATVLQDEEREATGIRNYYGRI